MKARISLFSPKARVAITRTLVLAVISLCILVGPKKAAAQSAQWSSWFSKIPEAKTGQWDNAVRNKMKPILLVVFLVPRRLFAQDLSLPRKHP
jgi:hypothetical protein